MDEEATDWTVCGRVIGRATGWDHPDTFSMALYGFQPADDYKGPSDDTVVVHFERGLIESYDDEGNVTQSVDLIEAIKDCRIDRIS
jgi:hypothetical protein